MCVKKVLQQRTSTNLICANNVNEDQYALSEHENLLLVIMGGHKLSALQLAMTFVSSIKTKEPDETQCMFVHSDLNKFQSGQAI